MNSNFLICDQQARGNSDLRLLSPESIGNSGACWTNFHANPFKMGMTTGNEKTESQLELSHPLSTQQLSCSLGFSPNGFQQQFWRPIGPFGGFPSQMAQGPQLPSGSLQSGLSQSAWCFDLRRVAYNLQGETQWFFPAQPIGQFQEPYQGQTLNPFRQVQTPHPPFWMSKMDQRGQQLLPVLLAKRSSSSQEQFLPSTPSVNMMASSLEEEARPGQISQSQQEDGQRARERLVKRIDKGFRILPSRITSDDMASIRNYSRIIGYPLKPTQRNTKLGYFTSVCKSKGCQATILVRKFNLLSPSKVVHNH